MILHGLISFKNCFFRAIFLNPIIIVSGIFNVINRMFVLNVFTEFFQLGIKNIRRAAAPNDHPVFIDALTDIVVSHLKSKQPINPKFLTRCPHCVNVNCDASKNWYAKICKI